MNNLPGIQPFIPVMGEGCDTTSLAQRVAEHLRSLIMEGLLPPKSQLPNEPDLSALLSVSRSTIRSALIILEQGGFIHRHWGVGTFISKNPPTYNNLSLNSGVTQLIRSSGAKPDYVELLIAERPASERVTNLLNLALGDPVVVIERVRLANDRKVVFSIEFLPLTLFQNWEGGISLDEIEQFLREKQSMYSFLRERMGLDIHHGIARIRPLSTEDYIAEKLEIPTGSSILYIEQVDYGNFGEPIALSDEYYNPDAFTFYIYRSN